MKNLHLAGGLELPLATVTQRLAFMGRSGSGKTYAAGKLAEEMLDAGAQVVVLDPVGNWYGLRVGAGGKGKGFEIPVLGGDQGDIPLEPAGGALVADTIVDRGISAVVDVSRFRKGQRSQFVTDFAEQLFHRKKSARTPMHLIVEEAHVFIPQRTMHGQERLLGAMEDLVRLGRNYGIGVSLLSQRPQSVNKDALNQTEILFALQLNGPQERAAIKAWVDDHGVELPKDKDFIRELPSLEVGQAWVWSPQFLKVLKKVHIAKKRTFDASATPDASSAGAAAPVKPLGEKDLEALRGAMKDVVKRAEEEDPKALRRRIAALEKEAAALRATPAPAGKVKRVEVAIVAEPLVKRIEAMQAAADKTLQALQTAIQNLRADMERRAAKVAPPPAAAAVVPSRHTPRPSGHIPVGSRNNPSAGGRSGDARMLAALAGAPQGLTRARLATLAGMKVTGGSFSTYLSRLRAAGHIEGAGDLVRATAAGLAAAGGARPAPSAAEVRELWLPRMSGGARRMLQLLIDAAPGGLPRSDLAERAEVAQTGGSFSTYLSRLRSNGLVLEDNGVLYAAEELVG